MRLRSGLANTQNSSLLMAAGLKRSLAAPEESRAAYLFGHLDVENRRLRFALARGFAISSLFLRHDYPGRRAHRFALCPGLLSAALSGLSICGFAGKKIFIHICGPSPHPDPLPSHRNGSGEGTAGGSDLFFYIQRLTSAALSGFSIRASQPRLPIISPSPRPSPPGEGECFPEGLKYWATELVRRSGLFKLPASWS